MLANSTMIVQSQSTMYGICWVENSSSEREPYMYPNGNHNIMIYPSPSPGKWKVAGSYNVKIIYAHL